MAGVSFKIKDLKTLKLNLLTLANKYSHAAVLDSNEYKNDSYSGFDLIAGIGAKSIVVSGDWNDLKALTYKKSWLFGFLSYDLKNQIEDLSSENSDNLDFPDLCFFEPEILVFINGDTCEIRSEEAEEVKACLEIGIVDEFEHSSNIEIQSKISKEKYIKQIIQILNHIQLGDVFEMNFCQEFYAEQVMLDPISAYSRLVGKSPVPFANFLKVGEKYCLGASPERFIKREGDKVLSQPIKGTSRRGGTEESDLEQISKLKSSEKEKSENVMIVDLVRNDFSRFAKRGTVRVEELFEIYTFPQVHQMISTITCEVETDLSSIDIIKNCFPMGSMTGAPKVRSMKLIEQYEATKRGLYSGAIGYIQPNGDFDFNVVIRSILYNASNQYLSFMVGGAITNKSNAQEEYNETLLKAKAIFEVLNNKH